MSLLLILEGVDEGPPPSTCTAFTYSNIPLSVPQPLPGLKRGSQILARSLQSVRESPVYPASTGFLSRVTGTHVTASLLFLLLRSLPIVVSVVQG